MTGSTGTPALPLERVRLRVSVAPWPLAGFALIAALQAGPPDPAATPPSPAEIDKAIDAGADHLLATLDKDPGHGTYRSDELVLYALFHAGKIKDPRAAARLQKLLKRGLDEADYPTYNVSLRAILLEAVDPVRHQVEIAKCAWWLVNAQTDNGQWDYYGPAAKVPDRFPSLKWPGKVATGVSEKPRTALKVERVERWNAEPGKGVGKIYRNTSTMQYALLGLLAAHRAHIVIPPETWTRALKVILDSQDAKSGGWGYIDPKDAKNAWQPASHLLPGMTAGNLSALAVLSQALDKQDPAIPGSVERGFEYLGRMLRLDIPPVDGKIGPMSNDLVYHYYYLFSLERAGILWGRERIGAVMWYAAGATRLVAAQGKDGSWGRDYANGVSDRAVNTAFAVLFLKRAVPPPVETGSGRK